MSKNHGITLSSISTAPRAVNTRGSHKVRGLLYLSLGTGYRHYNFKIREIIDVDKRKKNKIFFINTDMTVISTVPLVPT